MKNQMIIFLCCLSSFLICFIDSYGQATVISNSSTDPNAFIGWDAFTPFELNVKHEGDNRMIFGTNNLDRFGILNNAENNAIVLNNLTALNGAAFTVRGNSVNNTNIAIRSQASNITGSTGGYFIASNAPTNVGLYGLASSSSTVNYGVAGFSCVSSENARSFAIYGILKQGCSGWAGFFNGNTYTSSATLTWTASDEALKSNIQDFTEGMSFINTLTPRSYEFNPGAVALNFPASLQYGIMAQELAVIMPNAVKDVSGSTLDQEEPYSFMAVNNHQLIPVLVSAFKTRQMEIERQQQLISQLVNAITQAEQSIVQIINE